MHQINDIISGVKAGDFLLLARAISSVENKTEGSTLFLQALRPQKVPIIGITGPPGAGKSTLVSCLIEKWVADHKKVAVLSVDPSSPFHKGAILGDRIRMKDWYLNPNVFIRSLATRGHLGGLISGMIEITTLLQSVGFDIILVETVGVGQSEIEIASLADTTLVVLVPEAGDEVQMMKSGLLEIADIFVVNKSDRPDADTFANHIHQMIREAGAPSISPRIIKTIAVQQQGIEELMLAIIEHQSQPISFDRKKQLLLSKIVQLVVAQKMKKLDFQKIGNELEQEMKLKEVNIFEFTQKIVDHDSSS